MAVSDQLSGQLQIGARRNHLRMLLAVTFGQLDDTAILFVPFGQCALQSDIVDAIMMNPEPDMAMKCSAEMLAARREAPMAHQVSDLLARK